MAAPVSLSATGALGSGPWPAKCSPRPARAAPGGHKDRQRAQRAGQVRPVDEPSSGCSGNHTQPVVACRPIQPRGLLRDERRHALIRAAARLALLALGRGKRGGWSSTRGRSRVDFPHRHVPFELARVPAPRTRPPTSCHGLMRGQSRAAALFVRRAARRVAALEVHRSASDDWLRVIPSNRNRVPSSLADWPARRARCRTCVTSAAARGLGNTSRPPDQNPKAPSPTKSTGAAMLRCLQPRSRSSHDSVDSRCPSSSVHRTRRTASECSRRHQLNSPGTARRKLVCVSTVQTGAATARMPRAGCRQIHADRGASATRVAGPSLTGRRPRSDTWQSERAGKDADACRGATVNTTRAGKFQTDSRLSISLAPLRIAQPLSRPLCPASSPCLLPAGDRRRPFPVRLSLGAPTGPGRWRRVRTATGALPAVVWPTGHSVTAPAT